MTGIRSNNDKCDKQFLYIKWVVHSSCATSLNLNASLARTKEFRMVDTRLKVQGVLS